MATVAKVKKSAVKFVPLQRVLFWLVGLFVAAALVLMGIGLKQEMNRPDRLPIKLIQINGDFRHLQRADIQKAVAQAIDGGFFTVDMRKVRDSVLSMPWVEQVSVRRDWPDTLVMNVTEQVPLARWHKHSLVNVSGKVFKPERKIELLGLVSLEGPEGSSEKVVDFYLQSQKLVKRHDLKIEHCGLNERRDWSLRFDNKVTLILGRQQVENRLLEFLRVYPQLSSMPDKTPQRIDMRYEHGFAVKWHVVKKAETAALRKTKGRGDV